MTQSTELEQAEARVAAARERLTDTLGTIQARLEPRAIVREAVENGAEALQSGVAAAKRHPGKLAGIGALAAAFLARHRIAAFIAKVRRRAETDETPAPSARSPRTGRRAAAKRNQP